MPDITIPENFVPTVVTGTAASTLVFGFGSGHTTSLQAALVIAVVAAVVNGFIAIKRPPRRASGG